MSGRTSFSLSADKVMLFHVPMIVMCPSDILTCSQLATVIVADRFQFFMSSSKVHSTISSPHHDSSVQTHLANAKTPNRMHFSLADSSRLD